METTKLTIRSMLQSSRTLATIAALTALTHCGMTGAEVSAVSPIGAAASKSSDSSALPIWLEGSYEGVNFLCTNGALIKSTERSYHASVTIAEGQFTIKTGINLISEGAVASQVDDSTISASNLYTVKAADSDVVFGVFDITLNAGTMIDGKKAAAYSTISYDDLAALPASESHLKIVQVFPANETKSSFQVTAAGSPLCAGGTLEFVMTEK